jgi:hypothetical protein
MMAAERSEALIRRPRRLPKSHLLFFLAQAALLFLLKRHLFCEAHVPGLISE